MVGAWHGVCELMAGERHGHGMLCVNWHLHSICHGLVSYHGYVVERDSVLCELWIEDEKTVENCA